MKVLTWLRTFFGCFVKEDRPQWSFPVLCSAKKESELSHKLNIMTTILQQ